MLNTDSLKSQITGEVVLPTDPSFTALKSVFKKDANPAVIVVPKTKDEVATAIQFARENRLTLSIRNGGHSMIGASTNENGMVINMSHFDSVEVMDATKGLVRIGAGGKWGDVSKKLGEHGLAITAGDTNQVGVGGLTLGGGIGWMVRKYGMAIDNVVGAEIVTADGKILKLSEEENAELFWAVRGGGGNFGIVTFFDFVAKPCKTVFGGTIMFDVADREKILLGWADYMRTAPEELTTTVLIAPGFDPNNPAPMMMIGVCIDTEDKTKADTIVVSLTSLGKVISNDIGSKPYSSMLQDAPPSMPFRALNQLGFVKTLTPDFMKLLAANFGQEGTALLNLRSVGGAMNRVKPETTAFAHRDSEALVAVATFSPFTSDEQEAISANEKAYAPVKPFIKGTYVNFLTDQNEESMANAYLSETRSRLAKIKMQYDPENIFSQNYNIKPLG